MAAWDHEPIKVCEREFTARIISQMIARSGKTGAARDYFGVDVAWRLSWKIEIIRWFSVALESDSDLIQGFLSTELLFSNQFSDSAF